MKKRQIKDTVWENMKDDICNIDKNKIDFFFWCVQVHWVKVNERKIKDTVWEKMKDDDCDIDKNEIESLFAMKESGKGIDKKDPAGEAHELGQFVCV